MNELDERGRRLGELMRAAAPVFEPVRMDDLRGDGRARPRMRRATPLAATVAAAAAVAVLALILSLVSSDTRNHGHRPSGSDQLAAAVGYRWRVTGVVDSQGSVTAPSSMHASIGFTRDGYVLGDDSVNPLQGTYQPTSGGYTVHNVYGGGVGVTQNQPILDRIRRGVDDMFFTTGTNADQPPAVVQVTVHDDTLTLIRGNTTLTLQRASVQPNFGTGTPTATRSS